jgi:hypothetical protein
MRRTVRLAAMLALLGSVGLGISPDDRAGAQPRVRLAEVPDVDGTKIILVGDLVPNAATGPTLDHARAIAERVLDEHAAAIIFLGDLQYENSTLAEYEANWDTIWGRRPLYRPVTGNHELESLADFRTYWTPEVAYSYYSFDVNLPSGAHTHIVALNSGCGTWPRPSPSCGRYSPMVNWMRGDLAADNARCELVVFHEPAFATPAPWVGKGAMRTPWWVAEYQKVDLFVAAHNHVYEYFYPQTYRGVRSWSSGTRSVIVGTGGKSLIPFRGKVHPNSLVRDASHFGYLRVQLGRTSMVTEFVSEDGQVLDRHGFGCR